MTTPRLHIRTGLDLVTLTRFRKGAREAGLTQGAYLRWLLDSAKVGSSRDGGKDHG